MPRYLSRLPLGLLLVLVLLPAGITQAETNTVTVDPDSPAGTEYAIPIAKARGEGQDKKKDNGTSSSPNSGLFGDGIEPQGSGKQTTTTPAKQDPATGDQTTSATPAPSGAPTDPPKDEHARLVLDTSTTPDSGSGTLVAFIVGALVIVAIAAAGGRYLRRRPDRA